MQNLFLDGGRTVHYQYRKNHENQSDMTLVVINGTFNILENWHQLSETCGSDVGILTYDLRNQGGSSRDFDIYGFDEYSTDLNDIIVKLGIGNTIVLGYSSGSSIAVDFALKYPDRVSSLILAAPLINPYNSFRTRLFHQSLLLSLGNGGVEALFLHAYPLIYGSNYCERNRRSFIAFRERFISMFRKDELSIIMKVWLQSKCDINKLHQLTMPVRMMIGSEDPFNTISSAETLSKALLNLQVDILENCGHVLHIEMPERFHSAVMNVVHSMYNRSKGVVS